MRHSTQTLWAFVARADTLDRIETAIRYISRLDYLEADASTEMLNELRSRRSKLDLEELKYTPDFDLDEQLTFD